MKRNNLMILTLLCAAFFLACSTSRQSKLTKKEAKTFYLHIEKTACFGTCPVYEMSLDGAGKLSLQGKRFLDKLGTYHSVLPDTTFQSLVRFCKTAEWSTYESEYLTGYSDLPSTIYSYSLKPGDTTVVRVESDKGPVELNEIGATLEKYRTEGSWNSMNLD